MSSWFKEGVFSESARRLSPAEVAAMENEMNLLLLDRELDAMLERENGSVVFEKGVRLDDF